MDRLRIEIEIPWVGPSLNRIWAGMHWAKRKKIADEGHWAVKAACNGIETIKERVDIFFKPYVKGRLFDPTNYAVTAKVLEDGLVQAGILEGDSSRYVRDVVLCSPERSSKEPYTLVLLQGVRCQKIKEQPLNKDSKQGKKERGKSDKS